MNASEVRNVATLVLLDMAERAERQATRLIAVVGEPRSHYPYGQRSPDARERVRVWTRINWFRGAAKEYRMMAEQPERDEFDRLRKNFETEAELRGSTLRIGDAKPPLGEAIATLKKITEAVMQMPVTHGPQPGPEPSAAPPRPVLWDCEAAPPKNNCDCPECGTVKGA
jgi:hypothetical protein